jgi:hypothetical protein
MLNTGIPMIHYVYQIVDILTHQFYFGVRSTDMHPTDDTYMGSMKTWKPEDKGRLRKIVLCEFDTRELANEYEYRLIEMYKDNPLNENYHNNKNFMNFGRILGADTRKKMSSARLGKNNPMYGKKRPLHSKRMKENNPMFRADVVEKLKMPKTEEHKNKISTANSKEILQCDKKGTIIKVWSSITEASKETNINLGNISSTCLGIRNSAGGYIWEFKNNNG